MAPYRVLRVLAASVAAAVVVPALPVASAAAREPQAVLAVVDTGINPYHAAFRDRSPLAYAHPSTYLPGFPRDAVALPLTLDARDYWSAVRADCRRVWSKVVPGRLYWFPGTRIAGAVSFDETRPAFDCAMDQPHGAVLDVSGHGTMTASRAVGATYGACPDCRVVSVQFQTGFGVANTKQAAASAERSITWAAANASWIDAQSNSWGVLPVPDMTGEGGLFFESPALTRAAEAAARRHPLFWSSGNGVANFGGVVGMPTVGGHFAPSAIRVGAHDSGQVTTWSGQTPHVVADGCDSWAPRPLTTDEWDPREGGGTSAAAPYVAGGALAALRHARRLAGDVRTGVRDGAVARGRRVRSGPLADGVLTAAEWRSVVLATASPRPAAQPEDGPPCPMTDPLFHPTPLAWQQVPAGAPEYLLIGYGAVDRAAVELARRVLAGTAPAPDRAAADAWFAADRTTRESLHTVYKGL